MGLGKFTLYGTIWVATLVPTGQSTAELDQPSTGTTIAYKNQLYPTLSEIRAGISPEADPDRSGGQWI